MELILLKRGGLLLFIFVSFAAPTWSASVLQKTEGSCSPAIADVRGNVNIQCHGVDQRLADDIIKLLNEILTDTRKLEQVRRDLDKTNKRTDEIEARLSPRRLTPNQKQQLLSHLKANPTAAVKVTSVSGDAEGHDYATDLKNVFLEAGWKVNYLSFAIFGGQIPRGIIVQVKDPNDLPPGTHTLVNSLDQIGIAFRAERVSKMETNELHLIVGAKPQ